MGPEFEDEYMVTKATRTFGFMDPKYYELNILTVKSDVYSFGVVLLALLTGKRAILKNEDEKGPLINMAEFITEKISLGELERILDPWVWLPNTKEMEVVELLAYMALHCVNLEGRERPSMNDIVANLERMLALCDDSHGRISSISISNGRMKNRKPKMKKMKDLGKNTFSITVYTSFVSCILVDELVGQAVQSEVTSKKGRKEVESFLKVIEDMRSSLKVVDPN
ncbi:hypothetical protein GIB67_008846 [Kingdonia uniflora]|uniref:Protein kinase domain-containing protein n=1 Tax=Kingdonia uniflora TaxID=39325 RepID=A0A7J7LVK3_9MAGN|nr:hypothetical protein GIB67_008846 [Kingdonia uniflora]